VPEGALWLGWSLGGLFALQAALTRPDLRGLVLAASSPRFVAAPDWPRGTPASALAGFADDLRNDYAGTIGRFLALDWWMPPATRRRCVGNCSNAGHPSRRPSATVWT
jgi:pimeloyl-ACP methyl ester carboxylesterase